MAYRLHQTPEDREREEMSSIEMDLARYLEKNPGSSISLGVVQEEILRGGPLKYFLYDRPFLKKALDKAVEDGRIITRNEKGKYELSDSYKEAILPVIS